MKILNPINNNNTTKRTCINLMRIFYLQVRWIKRILSSNKEMIQNCNKMVRWVIDKRFKWIQTTMIWPTIQICELLMSTEREHLYFLFSGGLLTWLIGRICRWSSNNIVQYLIHSNERNPVTTLKQYVQVRIINHWQLSILIKSH